VQKAQSSGQKKKRYPGVVEYDADLGAAGNEAIVEFTCTFV
jgi:hypothetical protein